jgi:hypothetical protein
MGSKSQPFCSVPYQGVQTLKQGAVVLDAISAMTKRRSIFVVRMA